MNKEVEHNIRLLQELVRCGNELYTWCYTATGELLHSNCPEQTLIDEAFTLLGYKQETIQHGLAHSNPLVVGSDIGLRWGVDFAYDEDELTAIYVIGPAFFYDLSINDVEKGFARNKAIQENMIWRHRFVDFIPQIPTVPNIMFSRYLMMLHYCITQETIDASGLNVQTNIALTPTPVTKQHDRHKIWMHEQAMLQMVRTGNLNYHTALNNAILSSDGVPLKSSEPMRQAKNSLVVFISMVCRAAIEGGLSPEQAYSLGDSYIQNVEYAKDLSELSAIPTTMYGDFIHRVHKCRTDPKLSPIIQQCVDYIETHLNEKLTAGTLGELVGYTEYYVTRKFKEETGCFVNDYVKFARIEQAKILLHIKTQSIQDISDAVGFANRSYFSLVFKQVTGFCPLEFRNQSTQF